MGKPRIIKKSHDVGFYVMEAYEGKTIEQRCREMVETGEPIKDTSPLIYTPKEKGVRPEYNVRADKWDIAQGAMDAVNREKIAKGQQLPNETRKEETPMGAPESNQAGQPS
jgi:hypothetical protein